MKQLHLTGTLIAALLLLSFYGIIAHAAAVSGQGTWETTLHARDFDGDTNTVEGYYDSVLNITWLANVNYPPVNDRNWDRANEWAADLDFNGIDNWRLPNTNPLDGVTHDYTSQYDGSTDMGFNISAPGTLYDGSNASEFAHMFYNTLGNLGHYDASGNERTQDPNCWGWLCNTGPFINLRAIGYWSATESAPFYGNPHAFEFHFRYGWQLVSETTFVTGKWAVHDGDVGTPVPLGDINVDARVDIADYLLLWRFVLGISSTPTAAEIIAGDMNQNSQLDTGDIVIHLRTILGLI